MSKTCYIGDTVFARNYRGNNLWIPAIITKVRGPCSYLVKTNEEILLRRHIDQLRSCYSDGVETSQSSEIEDWPLPQVRHFFLVNIPASNVIVPPVTADCKIVELNSCVP